MANLEYMDFDFYNYLTSAVLLICEMQKILYLWKPKHLPKGSQNLKTPKWWIPMGNLALFSQWGKKIISKTAGNTINSFEIFK